MSNPLFGMFGNRSQVSNPMSNMLTQFNQFKNSFNGDPRQKVQELLNSGQMSQEQFNQLREMAVQFQKMFGNH